MYYILYISNTGQIEPVHPHYCAFLLLNAAKRSVLPQLFHEIKPYGFDINGKYECEAFRALQSGPVSLSCSEICVTMVSLSLSPPVAGQLFQLRIPDPGSALLTVVPGCLQSAEPQVSVSSRGENGKGLLDHMW